MPRMAKCCQLCNWEQRGQFEQRALPLAVCVVRRLRLCATHLRVLLAIAAEAGVDASEVVT